MSQPHTWAERYTGAVMNTFGPPKLVLTRGAGARVWDEHGKEYLDLLGGIAVNSLGHAHPALVEAVTGQLQTLGHVSNFFATGPQITLAERLLDLAQRQDHAGSASPASSPASAREGRVFFANSGAEANEAAFKATRKTGRTRIVAAEGAFHGRTMGALALTAKEAYRAPFEPLPGDVAWVPYGDAAALAAAVDDTVAAVVLEPIQGEAGVEVPPAGYLARAREITRQHGALLWLDEVQTGIGRTGRWLASAREPAVEPDLVTLAKGLAGGIPIGALLAFGPAATLLEPGNHGTTFGGNPIAAAAALAVIDTIEADGLLEHAETLGKRLRGRLAHPHVSEVRGEGLLIGLTLDADAAAAVVTAAQDAGFILNMCAPDRVRLAPPLVLTDADADRFLDAWPAILASAYGATPAAPAHTTEEQQ